jgi:hypothetical protein
MNTTTIAPILIMTAALVSMAAAWECFDVCPNAKDQDKCWKKSYSCNPDQCKETICGEQFKTKKEYYGRPICSDGEGYCDSTSAEWMSFSTGEGWAFPFRLWCPAYCSCNIFHRNCEPCGTGCSGGVPLTESSDGGIFSIGEGREYQEELSTGCDDYNKWMTLTKEEKLANLDIYYCHDGLEVNPEIHAILESLADSNDNNHMSCDEFNNAYDLEGMLERRRRLSNGEEILMLCLNPEGAKSSKSGKDKSGTSKTAKTQGKAKN